MRGWKPQCGASKEYMFVDKGAVDAFYELVRESYDPTMWEASTRMKNNEFENIYITIFLRLKYANRST